MGRTRNLIAGLAAALAFLALLVPAAQAQDPGPAYTDWNPKEVGYPSNAPFSPRATCHRGSNRCIDRTIGEMYRRFHTVFPSCDHNAVFSLTYIRVTEDIRRGLHEGFYDDEKWLSHLDALFARPYFLAYDNYRAGRIDLVPPAWRIAFDAGEDGTVKGIGNLLLSMNAHVNRDFPFLLYRAGLVDEKGNSRKAAHDSGNQRLRALYKPMLTELSRRFDESIDDYDVPGVAQDDEALFSVLVDWREAAWRNAELLAEASNDAERRQVAAEIEQYAVSQAELIFAGSAYAPGEDRSARDKRCAEHGGQHPGYARGSDVAHFRGGGPRRSGKMLTLPIACPDGPGPCAGIATARAGEGRSPRKRFRLAAGRHGHITLRVPEGAGEIHVRVKSLLGPGDAETKTRSVEGRSG